MINRDNYKAVKEYLSYLGEVKQLDPATVAGYWACFKYLLNYADDRQLYDIEGRHPTLPEYLRTVKGHTGSVIVVRTQARSLEAFKAFYAWAKIYKRGGYLKVSETWLDSLRARRRDVNASHEHKEHEFWSLEEILRVAKIEPVGVFEERARAAVCFLFLSGMRAGAFVTLPVDCVDIKAGRVEQKPSKGVVTKNRKSAVTWLLPIPEITAVVTAWDEKIRRLGCKNWFPALEKIGLEHILSLEGNGKKLTLKTAQLRESVEKCCALAGLPYKSPHKLRHGHGVYGVKNARNIEELKAVSQNMMHATIGITDGLYGVLPEENVRQVLSSFQRQIAPDGDPAALSAAMLTPEMVGQLAKLIAEQMAAQKQQTPDERTRLPPA